MTSIFLNKFNEIAEEANKEMFHHLGDKIREQDTYGVTKELVMFLSRYENKNIKNLSIKCNPGVATYLESNNLYFKKMKEVLPFQLELRGDPAVQARYENDHYIFLESY